MLTEVMEGDTIKCNQYWPEENMVWDYGQVTVEGYKEEREEHYIKRRFKVYRALTHFTSTPSSHHYVIKSSHFSSLPSSQVTSSRVGQLESANSTDRSSKKLIVPRTSSPPRSQHKLFTYIIVFCLNCGGTHLSPPRVFQRDSF